MFPWRRRKPIVGRLAVQLVGGSLSHAELGWDNSRPSLQACSEGGGDGMSLKAWTRFARAPVPVSLVLSPGEYQLLPIDAPPVPPQELTLAVRWRIKDLIEVPLDDVTVDVIRLGTGTAVAGSKLLAVVAHNDLLRRYLTLAEQAGVDVDAIDIPELAQRNIAALLEPTDRVQAVLSLTPQGGLLTVTCKGDLCFHRRVQFSPEGLTGPDRESVLQRLALELQRSLDYIDRHHSAWRLDRILLAPPPAMGDLADQLRQNLYLPLEVADLGRAFDGALPEPGTLAGCWFALGGALRRETLDL